VSALDGLDDRALLSAFTGGDDEAFGVLFRRHRDRLWAVALRTTGNPEDAADALQDAMVSAFRRADSFRGDAQLTTWLHRVVVNASLDRLRRNKVRGADALPDDLEEYAGRGAVLTSADQLADPEHRAVAADQRRRLRQALDRLAPEQKAALVLVDMEGYPVEEAARILECPTGTVKSRCARGRARLLELLTTTSARGTTDEATASHPGALSTPTPLPPTELPRGGAPA
jgi:RNA polymerase sigma-70 factor (ECF subfamily)